MNRIPVPIQFGLPQEEKSIAGERGRFFLKGGFFFSEAVLSPGRTQSYEGHSDCLPQISSFVFKKSYQCARPPGGRGRRGIRNQLRQINDYIFFSVSYNLYFRFPGPPTMSSPISYLSGLIPLYYHNASEWAKQMSPKKPPLPHLQTEFFVFFLLPTFFLVCFSVSQPPTVRGRCRR